MRSDGQPGYPGIETDSQEDWHRSLLSQEHSWAKISFENMHLSLDYVLGSVILSHLMKDIITKDQLLNLLRENKQGVIDALNSKHVVYLNQEASSIKANGVRSFTIKDIEKVATGKAGRTYITAKVVDHDDGDAEKYRSLHIAGLELAWQ
jgi:hypothetical protein